MGTASLSNPGLDLLGETLPSPINSSFGQQSQQSLFQQLSRSSPAALLDLVGFRVLAAREAAEYYLAVHHFANAARCKLPFAVL
jgi:hypothetical protein